MQRIQLKDIKNNTVVDVGIDEVPSMVASGHYALPKNASLPILNQEGELGEIASQEYMQALQSGYAPATTADIQKSIDVDLYGDSPLQTGLERAASAATFGATDFIASKLEPEYAKRMQMREELNPGAAITGEIVGVVGPALLTGGTSLAAKAVSAPARAAMNLGASASKAVAKALPKNGLAGKVVSEMIPRAAGLGVEGALYGAGNYISDASLGNADWSAESLISNVGMSGLLGGGIGAGLGAAKLAAAPVMTKIKGFKDVNDLAENFAGLKTVKGVKTADKFEDGEVAKYLVNDVNGGSFKPFSQESMADKAAVALQKNGDELDNLLTGIEAEAVANGSLPTRKTVLESIEKQLDNLEAQTKVGGEVVPTQKGLAAEISKVRDDWRKFFGFDDEFSKLATELAEKPTIIASTEPISIKELNDIRKMIGSKGKFDSPTEAVAAQINRELYPAFRSVIDNVAEGVGQKDALKELNRKLFLGIKLEPFMQRASLNAEKSGIINFRDIVAGVAGAAGGPIGTTIAVIRGAQKVGENSLVKSAQLIYAVKAAERKLDKAVSDSVRSFFLNVGKGVKASTLRLSTDAKEYSAFTKKVEEYATNPDAYMNEASKRDVGLSQQLPTVVASAQSKGMNAMNFLNSKMPKETSVPGMIPRKYIPSTQQRAKFMRYAEIVEDPKKALAHFQTGTLSKEHVETLQAVYPEMYKKLASTAAEYVALHGQKLNYSKKIQLGLLLNIPTDSSLNPSFIRSMQTGFVQSESMVAPGVTGSSKLNKADKFNYDADST